MGKVNLTIDDDLEREFRQVAFMQKGMKKGHLTGAIDEAITLWLGYVKSKKQLSTTTTKNDPLWPEEIQALEDIKSGKTKMIKQTGEEFLKKLEDITNEQQKQRKQTKKKQPHSL